MNRTNITALLCVVLCSALPCSAQPPPTTRPATTASRPSAPKDREHRRKKIAELMQTANRYRRQRRFDRAYEVLTQVLRLDPTNQRARDTRCDIEQIALDMKYVQVLDELQARTGISLKPQVGTNSPAGAWSNSRRTWGPREEIVRPRGRGERPANRKLRERMQTIVPEISFDNTKFEDAIQFVRDVAKVAVHVKWKILEKVGIKKDTPIDTKLKEVTLETALKILLDDVSGAAKRKDRLGYVLRDGVLVISTNADLTEPTTRPATREGVGQ